MLATHNSWSYLPPKHFWQYVIEPFSRCQEVCIENQTTMYGVEVLDLRVRFDVNSEPVVCHGLVDFDLSAEELHQKLASLDKWGLKHKLYIRLLFETRKPSSDEILLFHDFCAYCERTYTNIKWFGGHGAHGKSWFVHYYGFIAKAPQVLEKCSSTSETGIKRILPKRFAKLHNRDNIQRYSGEDGTCLMLDFINIQ